MAALQGRARQLLLHCSTADASDRDIPVGVRASKIALLMDEQVPRSTRMCESGLLAILSNQ